MQAGDESTHYKLWPKSAPERIRLPQLDAHTPGAVLFLFGKACGLSGYLLGVHPFDQPGVEAYKQHMLALLGRPGYEKQAEALRQSGSKEAAGQVVSFR